MTEKGLKKRSRGSYMKILIAFCVILFLSFYLVHRIIQPPYDYQARKQAGIEELDKTINSVIAHHNYNELSCVDGILPCVVDTYATIYTCEWFDEFIDQLTKKPNMLFHKNIALSVNDFGNREMLWLMRIVTHAKCVQGLDVCGYQMAIDDIKKLCLIDIPNLKSIKLRNTRDIEKITLMYKSGDFQCLYNMQEITDNNGMKSLLLTK
jgi:hypothetical protein